MYNSIETKPEEMVKEEINFDKGYITKNELLKIDRWKNRTNRNQHNIEKNGNDDVERIIKQAFNENNEIKKINHLVKLMGVSFPMASVILTFMDPQNYGVFDQRVIRTLDESGYKSEKGSIDPNKNLSAKTWNIYLDIIREIANKYEVSCREIDKALFAMDLFVGRKLIR